MEYIKTIIPLILVISILVGTSVSASAISTTLPQISNTDQIMEVWGTSNYSWSQNSSTYNMTLTAPYGDTSVLHGIMQGQALQNNTIIASRNSIVSELAKITNNTSSTGITYILNQILNKIGATTTSGTLLYEIHQLVSYWGGSTSSGAQKLTSIDSNIDTIQNILGTTAFSGNIADIVNSLKYNSSNTGSTHLMYYIFDLGHYWNKTGPTSANDAYYYGGNWFKYMLETQNDIVNAIDNKSFNFSSTVPTDLKSGWGTSAVGYPTGYSSSYYEAMRSILRDVDSKSSSIQSTTNTISQNMHDYTSDISGILTNTNTLAQNIRDYSVDLADINNQSGYILDELESLSVNDWSNSNPESMANSWYAQILNKNSSISDSLNYISYNYNDYDSGFLMHYFYDDSFYNIPIDYCPPGTRITIRNEGGSADYRPSIRTVLSNGVTTSWRSVSANSSIAVSNARYDIVGIQVKCDSFNIDDSPCTVYFSYSYRQTIPVTTTIASMVNDLRNTLANQADSDIRNESSTVINQYNTTFVNGDNGVKASDVTNIGSALTSVSDVLDSDFNFNNLPQVISDFTSEGLSFWSVEVHNSLNPFVGDSND